MRFLTSVTARNTKWFLIFGVALTLVVVGVRGADLLRLRNLERAKRVTLEETRLLAAIERQVAEAESLSYDDVGIAGSPLSPAVIEKLKANYRLPKDDSDEPKKDAGSPQEDADGAKKDAPKTDAKPAASDSGEKKPADEKPAAPTKDAKKTGESSETSGKKDGGKDASKKKLLTTATAAQLRSMIGVDERTARFIIENAHVRSWEDLAKTPRQLFDESQDAIEPMIVARVAKFAAEAGIEKIDQFKVEPPKTNVRRRAAANGGTANAKRDAENGASETKTKKDTTSNAKTTKDAASGETRAAPNDMNPKLEAVRKSLDGNDAGALLKSLDELVTAALGEDATERVARAELDGLLKHGKLPPVQAGPVGLAAIRLQPEAHFVATHLVEAYAARALKRFDAEGDGPVKHVEEPFPPLVMLPRPAQRRLLETLSKNGGAWLTDAQVKEIIGDDVGKSKSSATKPESKRDESAPARADAKIAGTDQKSKSKPKSETKPQQETDDAAPKPNVVTPAETDATKLRAFHAELVDLLREVADYAQKAKSVDPNLYSATLLFKCNLEQLVNFVYKLENDVRWLRVNGLRIAVEQPDQPMLGVTLSIEASVLKTAAKAGT